MCFHVALLSGIRIVPGLSTRISAKLRVMQLGAIGKDNLLQPAGRVAVLGDVHPNGDFVAGHD
jgi:hypothetical protein